METLLEPYIAVVLPSPWPKILSSAGLRATSSANMRSVSALRRAVSRWLTEANSPDRVSTNFFWLVSDVLGMEDRRKQMLCYASIPWHLIESVIGVARTLSRRKTIQLFAAVWSLDWHPGILGSSGGAPHTFSIESVALDRQTTVRLIVVGMPAKNIRIGGWWRTDGDKITARWQLVKQLARWPCIHGRDDPEAVAWATALLGDKPPLVCQALVAAAKRESAMLGRLILFNYVATPEDDDRWL